MHVLRTWIVLVLAAAAVMFGQVNWGSPSKAVGAFKMWELGSQPKPCQSPVPPFSLSLLSLFLGQAVYMGGVDRRTDPEILILLLFYSLHMMFVSLLISLSLSAHTVTLLDLVCAFVSGAIPSLLFLLLLSLLHQQFCLLYSVRCSSGMHTKHES